MMRTGLVLMVMTLLVAACGGRSARIPTVTSNVDQVEKVPVAGGSYTDISATQLHRMLTAKDFRLVNVHIPYEGEIAQTDAFIPYNEVDKHVDQLPTDKNARIVLYCRSGRMSAIAAEKLVSLGYTNVLNVKGGMVEWEKLGYALIRK